MSKSQAKNLLIVMLIGGIAAAIIAVALPGNLIGAGAAPLAFPTVCAGLSLAVMCGLALMIGKE